MHEWLVGGAVIEAPEGLLLVRNRRRDGAVDWTPPGGVIDEGEQLLEGLTREVREETGLVVTEWSDAVYEVQATAPGLGWRMTARIHVGLAYEGELVVDDPDGIVEEACFCPPDLCRTHLDGGHPWVREPLLDWLAERWSPRRDYRYRVDGTRREDLSVHRA